MSSAGDAALNGKATSKGNTSGQNESNSRPPLLRYAAAGNLNRSPAQRRVLASRMFSPQKSALKSALSSAENEYLVEGSSNQGINYNAKIAKADDEGFPDVAAFWMKKQEEEKRSTQNINAFLAEHINAGGGSTVATGAAAGNLNRSPAQHRVLASRMFSPQKSALESALSSAEFEYLVEGSSNQGINYNAKIAKADAEGFPDVAAFWMKKQEEEKRSTQNINAFLAAYEEGGYRRKGRRGSRTRRNKRSRRAKTRRAKTRR